MMERYPQCAGSREIALHDITAGRVPVTGFANFPS